LADRLNCGVKGGLCSEAGAQPLLDFIAEGGYATSSLWLSDGWAMVEAEGWDAPGYWRKVDGTWLQFTLAGLKPVEPDAPVCHVSYYEADAFARWAGKDLPSEAEWEVAARARLLDDAFGIVWQWTRSAYSPYPGFRAASGALFIFKSTEDKTFRCRASSLRKFSGIRRSAGQRRWVLR